jgi:hypothetical protein
MEMLFEEDGFPSEFCGETAEVVKRDLGLERILGEKKVQGPSGPRKDYHSWNYDPNLGLYIDLTHDQFGRYPKVLIFSSLECYKLTPGIPLPHLLSPLNEKILVRILNKLQQISQ